MRNINVYTFDELKENAKEKALDEMRNFFNDFNVFWEENNRDIKEYFYNAIVDKFEGVYVSNIYFSLNYCQGDGVCFSGFIAKEHIYKFVLQVYNNNIPRNIQRIIPFLDEIQFKNIDHRYTHAYTVTTNVKPDFSDECNYSRIMAAIEQFEKDIDTYRIDICKELEKDGYNMIDYFLSDENIISCLDHMQVEFYKDGRLYK